MTRCVTVVPANGKIAYGPEIVAQNMAAAQFWARIMGVDILAWSEDFET